MGPFLLKFDAIESRIAFSTCPRGVPSRVHALRLRRCFHTSRPRTQSRASIEHLSPHQHNIRIDRETSRPLKNRSLLRPPLTDSEASVERTKEFKPWHTSTRRWKRGLDRGGIDSQGQTLNQDVVSVSFPDTPDENTPREKFLYEALQRNDPHAVLRSLVYLVGFDGATYTSLFLEGVSQNSFSAILHCLDPKHFIGRYSRLYEEMSRYTVDVLGLPDIPDSGYHDFCLTFLEQIQGIMEARRRYHSITMADFKYLLKCAKETGNVQVARAVWRDMTNNNGITPDAECYNYYLATLCWTERSNTYQRYRLRVIPMNTTPRGWPLGKTGILPYSLQGHKVGRDGIKAIASGVFKQMVESGVSGNEETFCLMMTALAREGDVDGVASILNRVWHIDTEALLTTDEADLPPVRSYPLDSPFYPSENLLYTLAHVYGINNSIPTALRLVDYISRQYNIPVTIGVWDELLRWTYVLSSINGRGLLEESKGRMIGRLPPEAVSNLWATMTTEPYNIKPTMSMYDRLIRSLMQRQRFGEVKERMEEARTLHKQYVLDFARRTMNHEIRPPVKNPATEEERRDLAFAHLHLRRSRLYILQWVRLFLRKGSQYLKYGEDFTAKDIPDFLITWNAFLPKIVRYEVANGDVALYSDKRFMHMEIEQKMLDKEKKNRSAIEFTKWLKATGRNVAEGIRTRLKPS